MKKVLFCQNNSDEKDFNLILIVKVCMDLNQTLDLDTAFIVIDVTVFYYLLAFSILLNSAIFLDCCFLLSVFSIVSLGR
jgi:hypothetical protein